MAQKRILHYWCSFIFIATGTDSVPSQKSLLHSVCSIHTLLTSSLFHKPDIFVWSNCTVSSSSVRASIKEQPSLFKLYIPPKLTWCRHLLKNSEFSPTSLCDVHCPANLKLFSQSIPMHLNGKDFVDVGNINAIVFDFEVKIMIFHSEQEGCDNEFQTAVGLSGYPGQQGLSFFPFFAIKNGIITPRRS